MAEGEGIEPPNPFGSAVFKTVSSSIRTPSTIISYFTISTNWPDYLAVYRMGV